MSGSGVQKPTISRSHLRPRAERCRRAKSGKTSVSPAAIVLPVSLHRAFLREHITNGTDVLLAPSTRRRFVSAPRLLDARDDDRARPRPTQKPASPRLALQQPAGGFGSRGAPACQR